MSTDNKLLVTRELCPYCEKPTHYHAFFSKDGVLLKTHFCQEHGDIIPIHQAIPAMICAEPVDWAGA